MIAERLSRDFRTAGTLVLLSLAVFTLDLLAPLAVAAWILYLLPLSLTLWLRQPRAPLYLSGLVTLLMAVAHPLRETAGSLAASDLFSRLMGIAAIWVVAIAVARAKSSVVADGTAREGRRLRATGEPSQSPRTGRPTDAQAVAAVASEGAETEQRRVEAQAARRRVEEGLLAGQLRLESIVQSAMDAIITVDEEQSIVLFNHAAELMFDCRAEDALGGPLERFIPHRFREAHRHHITSFEKSGTTTRRMGALGQVWGLTAMGEEFPLEAAISQIAVDGRKFLTVILRDTRERERLKRELEEREALLRTIIETEPECVKVMSPDGTILSMNAAGLSILETEHSRDVVGKSVCDFVVPEYHEAVAGLLRQAAKGEACLLQYETVGLRGGRRWLETHAVSLPAAQGVVPGILAVTRDVTARKQAEMELKQSEERLQSILASMEEVVWSSSADLSRLLYVSPGVDRICGRAAADILATPPSWFEMIHPDDRRTVEESIRTLSRVGQFDVEYRILRPDGAIRFLRHRGRLIADETGRPLRVDGIISDVTGTKFTEMALRRAQERFQDIFESSKDAIGYVSLDERFVLANEAFARLTGYSREELLGKTQRDLTPPEFRSLQAQEAVRVLQTGEPVEYEKEYIRKDGVRVPVAVTLFIVKGDDGKADGIAAIVRDITERKRAEQALRESEERFRQMAETIGEVIWIKALYPEETLYVSPAFGRIWGLSPEGLYRDPQAWIKAIHAEDRAQVSAQFTRWLADEGRSIDYNVEYRIVRPDGSIRWIHDRGSLIRNKEGRVYRATGIAEDITRRKTTEVLLLQSEQRYRQLVEVSPDAIIIIRGDQIVFINKEGLELLGATTPEQILGRSPYDFVLPDFHQEVRERMSQLLDGLEQQVPLVEEKFVRLDGSVVEVEVTAARYIDQKEPAVQVVLRDITQRRRLQEQLRRTERVAELGTLASGMAHEIGTPMNVILGRAEYLMNRTRDEPVKTGLQTIISQVERITRVMNQLLSFARRRAPERRPVRLTEVVETSLEMFRERLGRHDIAVGLDIDPSCPPVHADPDQMSQVLINLLMNAIHAMPQGGQLRIEARSGDQGMVQLTISDTGTGMPPEVAQKIFDPFFTTKEFGVGTGLGLTVVKGIMEEHGGTIAVESEPGHGTTFTLRLPVSESMSS